MHPEELLSFVDELIFAQTGKHLNDLQKSILQGSLEGKHYSDIAEDNCCTDGHVRDVASQLWKILSQELGEEVRKKNLSATMKRFCGNVSNLTQDFVPVASNFDYLKCVAREKKPLVTEDKPL